MKLFKGFEEIVEKDKPLASLTTFRLGGPADYFIVPQNEDQLRGVLERAAQTDLPIRVLGNGSNVLVSDEGVRGVVIQLSPKGFGGLSVTEALVRAGASLSLAGLVRGAAEAHLSGLEPLVGIPGWVGGAVRMNAGGKFGDIGQVVERVKVMDTKGQSFYRERDDLAFGYRTSNISARFVLEAELRLTADSERRISHLMKEVWITKKNSQPMANRSAGCVFKNPRGLSAGALIDQVGLKGTRVGGASVSRKHANYIVAGKECTAKDVRDLIELVRKKVHERTETFLELELEVWT
ncbi:MAG TPA: UDP-N-acetylmuramate dehydrogenase [Phycisphaerae bacterium]|nr:UDP-N-acetylmuramate dehydrogenase [Phycisphaerae bacterium]